MSQQEEARWKPEWLSALRCYRSAARRRLSKVVFGMLLVVWIYGILEGYLWKEKDEASQTWSLLRMADVELTIARELEAYPDWLARGLWLDEGGQLEREWIEEFAKADEARLLTADGKKALTLLKAHQAGQAGEISMEGWEERWREDGLWAWEFALLQRGDGGEEEEWVEEALAFQATNGKELFGLLCFGQGLWLLLTIVGLPFVPAALRCFRTRNHVPLRPLARVWSLRWLLGAYLISDLGGDGFWFLMSLMSELWESAPTFTMVTSDTVWRLASPAVMITVLCIRWRDWGRVVGMHIAPKWRPVLGMVPLAFTYNFVLYWAWEKLGGSSGVMMLDSWEEGWSGLFYVTLSSVILAPLTEEIVFRGFLFQKTIARWGFWGALAFSTMFFALIHFYDVPGTLSVAFFGVAACALYRATGSLWTGICYHALINGVITLSTWPMYHGHYAF